MTRRRSIEDRPAVSDEFRDVVHKRFDCLAALVDQPGYKRDLLERLDSSRSTVDRAIDELTDHDLVEVVDGQYRATTAGRLAVDRYLTYRSDLGDIESTVDVLSAVPDGTTIEAPMITGAHVHDVGGQTQVVLSLVGDSIRNAVSVRAALPRLADSRMLDAYRTQATRPDTVTELVVAGSLLEALRDRFPSHLRDLASADGSAIYRGDVPTYGLVVTGDPVETAFVILYTDTGGIAAVLELTRERSLEWAAGTIDTRIAAAADRTDQLALLAIDDRSRGEQDLEHPLPAGIESEGFRLLSEALFERRGHASLLVSWRTGISLGGVAAGQAVTRYQDRATGTVAVTDELTDRLAAGDDTLVVGPPGSGKSTVCRQVVVEWHEADRGPVFYREHGRGETFDSVAQMRHVVDDCSGHALVVVEDVEALDARAALELRSEFAGTTDVSFLFDSRRGAWSDAHVDPRTTRGLSTYEMPALSVAECQRLLDHLDDELDTTTALDASSLYESVHEPDAEVGDFFMAVHYLARLVDPVSATEQVPSSTLSDSAGETLDRLRSRGEIAVDVGVLVNLLNVSGVSVDPGLLFSLGDPEFVEAALEVLDGVALFPSGTTDWPLTQAGTVHETWSVAFLEHLLRECGAQTSRESVGRCLSAEFSLTDTETRASVADRVPGSAPTLDRLTDDPEGWQRSLVERLFAGLGEWPRLAPLIDNDVLERVPASVRPLQRYRWLGNVSLLAGDTDGATHAFEQLRAEVTDVGNARYRAAALAGLGRTVVEEARYDDAERTLAAALALANRSHCGDIVTECLVSLATAAQRRGDHTVAIARNEQALARSRAAGEEYWLARAHHNLGSVHQERSNYDRAEHHGERALDLYESLGDHGRRSKVLSNLGNTKLHRGDHAAAAEYYQRALNIATESGLKTQAAATLTNLGDLERERSNGEAAERYLQRAVSMYRQLGDDAHLAVALNNLGLVRQSAGNLAAATDAHEEARALREQIGNPRAIGVTEHNLAECAHMRGDLDTAASVYRDSIEHLGSAGTTREVGLTHAALAEVHADRGDIDAAVASLTDGVSVLETCGARRDEAAVRHTLAETLCAGGRVGDAHEVARRARSLQRDL